MSTLTLREYQLSQLELLDETDRVCAELGIPYYMIGGTLLGAVRHGGFIPWDEDMDIAMRREDYERFRAYWAEHPDGRYFYQHYDTEKNHLSPHALLVIKDSRNCCSRKSARHRPRYDGLFLDIFPLDEPPAEEKKQLRQAARIRRLKMLVEWKAAYVYPNTHPLKRVAKRLVQLLLGVVSLRQVNRWLDREMQRYNGSGSGYLVSMASHYSYKKQLMPTAIYGEAVRVGFEGRDCCAPAQTEEYLRRLFGDYMRLPPEDKRHADLVGVTE